MPRGSSSSSGIDRNVKEKNRRMFMKHLLNGLSSVLPDQSFKLPVNELLDQATAYTKNLKERIKELNERKQVLDAENTKLSSISVKPEMKITSLGSNLEVNIITGPEKNFMLHEVISILQQEGADVVNLSYHNQGGRELYTIHVKAFSSRIGIESSRLQERLMNMLREAI